MDKKSKLIGHSKQTPIENKVRKIVVLPGTKSEDFIVTARCKIINVGTRTSVTASDLPGEESGTFTWSTNSSKIRIVNSSGPIAAIEAFTEPSAGRNQETITVIRTSKTGIKTEKTVQFTVVRITFGPSSKQAYGYDDYDTPTMGHDHHVSVRGSDSTLIDVNIEGGAVGTDFDFVFDNKTACKVGKIPDVPRFDLSIQAITGVKTETILRAKSKCPSQPEFNRIFVNIYPKVTIDVLVAKVADSRSSKTALRFPSADYGAHQEVANRKLRDAVVEFRIQNFNVKNEVTNVAYDINSDGALAFDINNGGGKAFEIIDKAVENTLEQNRVVIVRGMKSFYYLSRPARKGDKEIFVKGDNIFTAKMVLGIGENSEDVVVMENLNNIGYLKSPLTKNHPAGEPMEFPAAGWGTDPVIICEGDASLEETKWTIIHEVGHTMLKFLDVIDPNNVMHFSQDNSDYRLRYCPRIKKYSPDEKENQWETVPRTQKSLSKDEA